MIRVSAPVVITIIISLSQGSLTCSVHAEVGAGRDQELHGEERLCHGVRPVQVVQTAGARHGLLREVEASDVTLPPVSVLEEVSQSSLDVLQLKCGQLLGDKVEDDECLPPERDPDHGRHPVPRPGLVVEVFVVGGAEISLQEVRHHLHLVRDVPQVLHRPHVRRRRPRVQLEADSQPSVLGVQTDRELALVPER